MKIGFFCNDGSPMGLVPIDIYERGMGGAELALFSLAGELADRDHEVWIFNNPRHLESRTGINMGKQNEASRVGPFDAFVLFRSPNAIVQRIEAKRKLFWSCDQMTVGDYRKEIFPFVDGIVTISRFHHDFMRAYWDAPAEKLHVVDIGVRTWDYNRMVDRVPGRMIYCSVPDRGLEILGQVWPQIQKRVENAQLVVTGDYTLWGAPLPGTHKHKLQLARLDHVHYLGKISRVNLVKEQLRAAVQPYPCTYPELFCISAAECQVAGAIPVTSNAGALRTTNKFGTVILGDPTTRAWKDSFVEAIVKANSLSDEEVESRKNKALSIFGWETVVNRWIDLFEGGTPSDRLLQ